MRVVGEPGTAEAITLPPPRDAVLLAVALVAVSTSAPLIAATAAPALAIACWRNLLAGGVLLPVALVRRHAELRGLDRRQWGLCLLAGVLLAGHFAAWIPSVTLTSVASSTALVATQPVWVALLALAAGRRVSRAVLGAILGAAYVTAGAAARARITTTTYTTVCYWTCALILVAACLLFGQPL